MEDRSRPRKIIAVSIEILSWFGMVGLLLAYLLGSFNILPASGLEYQTLNLASAVFLMLGAFKHRFYPSAAVNAVWAIIGSIAIIQIIIK